jgi:hypothetical protein
MGIIAGMQEARNSASTMSSSWCFLTRSGDQTLLPGISWQQTLRSARWCTCPRCVAVYGDHDALTDVETSDMLFGRKDHAMMSIWHPPFDRSRILKKDIATTAGTMCGASV